MNESDLERRITDVLTRRAGDAMSAIPVEEDLDILRRRATREWRWHRSLGVAAVLVMIAASVALFLPEGGRTAPDADGVAAPSVSAGTDSMPAPITVDILAGSPSEFGSTDGRGADARFTNAQGIGVDSSGTVYVTDSYDVWDSDGSPMTVRSTIRMITADGTVTTLVDREVGPGSPAFGALAVDSSGVRFVAEGGAVSRMAPSGQLALLAGDPSDTCNAGQNWQDGTGGDARLGCILGMAAHDSGTLYVAADGNLGSVSPDGTVNSLGTGATCRGCWPNAVAVDAGGRLYFTADDYKLRMLTLDGRGTVLQEGPIDERGMGLFGRVGGVAVDPQGSRIFVSDVDGLNRVTPDGAVMLVGDQRLFDRAAAPHEHEYLGGIAMGADGTIYAIQNGSSVLKIRGA